MQRRPSNTMPTRRRVTAALTAAAAAIAVTLIPGPAGAATTAVDQWTGNFGDTGNSSTNAGEHVLTEPNAAKITTAWTDENGTTTPDAPVVLGGTAYHVESGTGSTFVATAAKTGATSWSMTLPGSAQYFPGLAASGTTVLVSFIGQSRAGGVIAIDVTTHKILWTATLPASTIAGQDNTYPEEPYTDGTRVYVEGSSNVINAYSFTTGKLQWTVPVAYNSNGTEKAVDGIAAGGGYVYTSGDGGVYAYDASTGKQVWQSRVQGSVGTPVLAGGRVFVGDGGRIEAFPATGCGASTCAATWSTPVNAYDPHDIAISAADSTSLFLTYTTLKSGSNSCTSNFVGNIERLSATTGAVQWKTTTGDATVGLIRGGNTVWVINEYWNSSCNQADRILAYSATATTSTPAATINLPSQYDGFPQSLAVASGTLFEQTWVPGYLVGYRLAGS